MYAIRSYYGYFHADEDLAAWGADHHFADVPSQHAWLQQLIIL